jgi:hypothetical protein
MGRHGTESPGAGSSQTDATGHGAEGQSGTTTGPGAEATATISERELCDTLTREAKLHVEDVQGGVLLHATLRPSGDLSLLRDRARQLERRAGQPSGGGGGPSCELFAIARSGAVVSVAEAPDSVRILLTTTDPNQVRTIRKQVRAFANAGSAKSGNQGGGNGSQGGGRGQ